LALLLNLTAGLLKQPLAIEVTKWGWELFLLHLTYVIVSSERGNQVASKLRATFRRYQLPSYIVVALMGSVIAILYWIGINRAYAKVFNEGQGVADLSVMAFTGTGTYKKGTIVAGISWIDSFSEMRVSIGNTSSSDCQDVDILLRPDEPVAGIGQATNIPNVSFVINSSITVPPPQLVTLPSGETKSVQVFSLAFNRGYRVRCDKLPKRSHLDVVMAIAKPTGNKGFAFNFKDGATYWARADIDEVKTLDEYFAERRLAKKITIQGDYTIGQLAKHIDRIISLVPFGSSTEAP